MIASCCLPADTCEASNTKDFAVLDNGHGAGSALKLLPAHHGRLIEHRCRSSGCHDRCLALRLYAVEVLSYDKEGSRDLYHKKSNEATSLRRSPYISLLAVLPVLPCNTPWDNHATMG